MVETALEETTHMCPSCRKQTMKIARRTPDASDMWFDIEALSCQECDYKNTRLVELQTAPGVAEV